MGKLSDTILSWVLKRGVNLMIEDLCTDIDVPDTKIKVHIQAKNVSICVNQTEDNIS